MYNKLHLGDVTSPMTPADIRAVKISSHLLSHKDNISHYFTCFQYNPMLLQPKHCLASVSANRVINIHIFTQMRWETHWRAPIHTRKRKYTHTPRREISWLLKYNYLTAGCHLGRCLDRLFLSIFLSIFLSFLCIPLDFCFPRHWMYSLSFLHHLSSLKHCLADPTMPIWFNLQVFYWYHFQ